MPQPPGDLGVGVLPGLAGGVSQTTVATPGTTLTTTATVYNVASKLLQPGTYLVWGVVDFALAAATVTEFRVGLSTANNTLLGQAGSGGIGPDPTDVLPLAPAIATDTVILQAGPTIVTFAAATTIYLNAELTFSAGSATAYGTLSVIQL